MRIPLLAQGSQRGGVPILDRCIVQRVDLRTDAVLYQHPPYHRAEAELAPVA